MDERARYRSAREPRAGRGEEEISKKDILRETGVSYGQFYRWKRMSLIPESWFRRHSTFTGQESFLPRQKVLQRIRQILELKDRYSLEQIGEMLSPDAVRRTYSPAEVGAMRWISPRARELTRAITDREEWRFVDVVCAMVLDQLMRVPRISENDIQLAASALLEKHEQTNEASGERYLVLANHDGATIVLLHTGRCVFGGSTSVVAEINLGRLAEDAKVRLRDIGETD